MGIKIQVYFQVYFYMPQLSLYIPEDLLNKLRAAAAEEKTTLSKWVALQLEGRLNSGYPAGFSALAGSLADEPALIRYPAAEADDLVREGL